VQEGVDLIYNAFDMAEKYRHVVIIVADGNIGQMMEPVELPAPRPIQKRDRGWELTGATARERRVITSVYLGAMKWSELTFGSRASNVRSRATRCAITSNMLDDADFAVIAFGTAARVCQTAVTWARTQGIRVGLFARSASTHIPRPVLRR